MIIDLAKDFNPYPSGRVQADGDWNGERFRKEVLLRAIREILDGNDKEERIVINIDGVRAFGSSFLEEAFGGLNREEGIDALAALNLIDVKSTEASLKFFHEALLEVLREAKQNAQ